MHSWSGRRRFARHRPLLRPWLCAHARRGPRCWRCQLERSIGRCVATGHAFALPPIARMEACRRRQGKGVSDAGDVTAISALYWPLASVSPIWEDAPSRGPAGAPLDAGGARRTRILANRHPFVGYNRLCRGPGGSSSWVPFGLTIGGWRGRLGLLRHSPRAISSKKTAYFVVGGDQQSWSCRAGLPRGPSLLPWSGRPSHRAKVRKKARSCSYRAGPTVARTGTLSTLGPDREGARAAICLISRAPVSSVALGLPRAASGPFSAARSLWLIAAE